MLLLTSTRPHARAQPTDPENTVFQTTTSDYTASSFRVCVHTTGATNPLPGNAYIVNYVALFDAPSAVNTADNGIQLAALQSIARPVAADPHCTASGAWQQPLPSVADAVVLLGLNTRTPSAPVGAWVSSLSETGYGRPASLMRIALMVRVLVRA